MMTEIAQTFEFIFSEFANFMWGLPLVFLLVGGGLFFAIYSRLLPYRHFGHAINILRGKYDDPNDEGDIPHFQALSAALSGTLGLGNVAGVAVAISLGGPGAIFWMWVTAMVGVATKFYTCTLAVMYRGRDSQGHLQGGPMYVIREALGPRWKPLAMLFCVAGLFGTLPIFQVNQLVQLLRDTVGQNMGLVPAGEPWLFNLAVGLTVAVFVAVVILGDIQRIGRFAARIVPGMVLFYLAITGYVLIVNSAAVPAAFTLIFTDAFSGEAAASGVLVTVILMGVRRGVFSNEAGLGTEAMAHGAAKTNEPVREGLVAMLGPMIDTLVVCTCTALVILVTGAWHNPDVGGVTMTALAFESAMPGFGQYALLFMVVLLSVSTIVTMWYYGAKCLGFLIGAEHQHHYIWIYVVLVLVGALVSLKTVIGLIDGMYAVMAIPTMLSTLILAPKVNAATRRYFQAKNATADSPVASELQH